MMITPNGRFATNTRICMSMSDFHPVRRPAVVFLLWNGRRCVVSTCTNAMLQRVGVRRSLGTACGQSHRSLLV